MSLFFVVVIVGFLFLSWLLSLRLVLICIRGSQNIDEVLFQKSEHPPYCQL